MIRTWKETTKYCNLHLYWFSRRRLTIAFLMHYYWQLLLTLRWRSCELRENSGDHSLFSSLQSLVPLKGLYNVFVLRIWFFFPIFIYYFLHQVSSLECDVLISRIRFLFDLHYSSSFKAVVPRIQFLSFLLLLFTLVSFQHHSFCANHEHASLWYMSYLTA